ncbi:exodeoxyribonuclease V subunit alpha [Salinicola salarius]|uniref:exodeoxyribonuclease V subunit alpha n=1 Tax=Salinicola salarius TaxID=430457 RepID=UPI000DA24CDA|nr:exodeoxyribonuclease V subunit alpha [Salinicola salarius]MDF3919148.1 exodeoxyribonuclease V subunit alpha [Salinicola salarius]
MNRRPSSQKSDQRSDPHSREADQFTLALDVDEPALTREALFEALALWVELGWLRQLDRHFAIFLAERDPGDDPLLWLAAALASHQVGRGHVCLSLSRVLEAPRSALSLPPLEEGNDAAQAVVLPESLLEGVTPQRWAAVLAASSIVALAGEASGLATPLVLDGERLYLRRYWQAESGVAAHLRQRLGQPLAVADELAEQLAALFAGNQREGDDPDWQRVACALALRQRLTIISGGPGTGKTTTVTRLLALLQQQSLARDGEALRIRLAAPTGKAAARLSESIAGAVGRLEVPATVRDAIPQEAQTLHRLLGARPDTRHFRHHAEAPLSLDLLVVDEASMVDLEMMAALLEAMPADARLILLGDKDQLASVEAGSVLGDLCAGAGVGDGVGYSEPLRDYLQAVAGEPLPAATQTNPLADHVAMLRKSFRFRADSGIGALARAANAGDGRGFVQALKGGFEDLATLDIDATAFERAIVAGYRELFEALRAGASPSAILALQSRFQVLCALRRGPWGVEGLNERIARALWQQGWISRTDGWFAGRPVMVTHNDPQLGLYNGDLGLTLPDEGGRLRVCFPQGDGVRQVLPSRLDAAATAFAMTVHKSQGSEFEHVLFALPARANPIVTRELIYTGITRARSRLTLALAQPQSRGGSDERMLRDAVARRVVRDSAIAERLLKTSAASTATDLSGREA